MFVDFEKHSYTITNISYDEACDDDSHSLIMIETDGLKNFDLLAVGDCCSVCQFRKWDNVKFETLIGKVIKDCMEIDLPENYKCEDSEFYGINDYQIPHLYEMTFKNSSDTFKFMLINYSNGYYDGWIEFNLINKKSILK